MEKANALPALALENIAEGRLRLNGYAVFSTVPAMESLNNTAFLFDSAYKKHLEISLSGIEKADSAGLALLVEWKAAAQRRGIDLRYKAMPEPLQAMMDLCGLSAVLVDDE